MDDILLADSNESTLQRMSNEAKGILPYGGLQIVLEKYKEEILLIT